MSNKENRIFFFFFFLLTVLWLERLVHSCETSPFNSVVRLETQPEEPRRGLYYLWEGAATEPLLQTVVTMPAVSYLQVVVRAIITVLQIELVPKVQPQQVARFRCKKKKNENLVCDVDVVRNRIRKVE